MRIIGNFIEVSLSLVKLAGRLWTALSPRRDHWGTLNIILDNILKTEHRYVLSSRRESM